MAATAQVVAKLHTVDEQRELFLWKYRDVKRNDVCDLMKDFKKFDTSTNGELDYSEAMRLLEFRGTVKTAKELMDWVGYMDVDHNRRVTFIELCCAFFEKSYDDLFTFVDEEARQRAIEEAMKLGEEAKKVEQDIEKAKQQKELQAQLRAAALERESKLTGVAGMRAFFFRQVEGAQDVTKTNEQQIKEEAARRKALRDAKTRMNDAIKNANRVKSAEEVAKEVALEAERRKKQEEADIKRKEEDEKAARAARKAALNAKWGGGSAPVPPSVSKSGSGEH